VSESQCPPVNCSLIVDTANQVEVCQNTVKILGQIEIFGNSPHIFAGIVDENGVAYAIYPPSREEELRMLQGHLIEFTVIILDEPRGAGGLFLRGGTVTPLGWEIVEKK